MRPDTPAPATARPVTGSGRLVWADAAKGLCILLVVMHHLTTKHYDLLVPDGTLVEGLWQAATDALKPVRMPLFFLISGMFAAGALRRPWRDVARRRIATPYYLYAVWLVLHAAFFAHFTVLPMNRSRTVAELLTDAVLASTGLWYLYALAAYFVVAKLLAPLDPRLVIVSAAAVSASTSLLPIDAANRESVLQHFVFFLVGASAPALAGRVVDAPRRRVTGALVSGSAAVGGLAWVLGLPQSTTTLLVSIVGVPLALRLVAATSAHPWVGVPAAALGRQTLPVYVLHVPLLSLLHHVVVQVDAAQSLVESPAGPVVLAVYPMLATVAVVAACLGVHRLMTRGGMGVLFELPVGQSRPAAPRLTSIEEQEQLRAGPGDQHRDDVDRVG